MKNPKQVLGLTLLSGLAAIIVFILAKQLAPKRDSIMYWATAFELVHGANPYARDVIKLERSAGAPIMRSKYGLLRTPPWSLAVIMPLALFGPTTAGALWELLSLACLIASLRLCGKMFPHVLRHNLLAIVGFAFAPVLAAVFVGQMGLVFLLGLVVFLRYADERPWIAAAGLYLLALKPHLFGPWFVVVAFWVILFRRWRLAVGFTLLMLVTTAIDLMLDPHIFRHYQAMMVADGINTEPAHNLVGAIRAWLAPNNFGLQFVPVALACIGSAFYYLHHRSDWNWSRQGLGLLLASIIVAPYAFFTDEAVLLPIALVAIDQFLRTKRLHGIAILGVINLSLLTMVVFQVPMLSTAYVWSVVVWAACFFEARRIQNVPTLSRNDVGTVEAQPS